MSNTLRLVRPGHPVYAALGLHLYPSVRVSTSTDGKTIRLAGPAVIQHSGKLENRDAPLDKLTQGRIYALDFGILNSNMYDVVLSINPKIGLTGIITNPGIMCAKTKHSLLFPLYTIKQTTLSDLEWIVAISVLS